MKFNFRERFKGMKKSKKIISGILTSIFFLTLVTAVWLFIGYEGSTTANVVGATSEPMIITEDLTDFGVINVASSVTPLTYVKNFSIEPPIPSKEMRYYVFWNVTKTELNASECVWDENEVNFSLSWIAGRSFDGLLTNGQLVIMTNSPTNGANVFQVKMDLISRVICPVDYVFDVEFIPHFN